MRCIGCGSAAVSERSERTAQGYRRFRCRGCGKQFNERSESLLNRTQYPLDVIALVVLWRLRYKLSLRDLPEMFLIRGIVFSHEAVRDWEAKLRRFVSLKTQDPVRNNVPLLGRSSMAKNTTSSSLPRGTRIVTRAFFEAANGFPEPARPSIIKAALTSIRDELKTAREKVAVAKAKAKAPPKENAAKSAAKPAPRKAPAAAAKKAAPKTPAPAETKKEASKKATPKKSAAKRRAGSDAQAAVEAADVAETTSPEAVSTVDE